MNTKNPSLKRLFLAIAASTSRCMERPLLQPAQGSQEMPPIRRSRSASRGSRPVEIMPPLREEPMRVGLTQFEALQAVPGALLELAQEFRGVQEALTANASRDDATRILRPFAGQTPELAQRFGINSSVFKLEYLLNGYPSRTLFVPESEVYILLAYTASGVAIQVTEPDLFNVATLAAEIGRAEIPLARRPGSSDLPPVASVKVSRATGEHLLEVQSPWRVTVRYMRDTGIFIPKSSPRMAGIMLAALGYNLDYAYFTAPELPRLELLSAYRQMCEGNAALSRKDPKVTSINTTERPAKLDCWNDCPRCCPTKETLPPVLLTIEVSRRTPERQPVPAPQQVNM